MVKAKASKCKCLGSNPATKDCQKVGQFFLLSPKLQKVVSIFLQSPGALVQSPGAISWWNGNLIVQWFNFVVEWQSPGAIVQSPGAMVESRGAMVQSPSAMGTELYNIGD